MTEPSDPAQARAFHTTQWTQVLAARGDSAEARKALDELCVAYYGPVETFVGRLVPNADAAREHTQEFFAKLLTRGIDRVNPERGKFRTYLLGAVKHYLADAADFRQAARRAANRSAGSLHDSTEAAGLSTLFPPDAYFDRQWAIHLLNRVLAALAAEYSEQGKEKEFKLLRPWLTGHDLLPSGETATQLGLSASAFKSAVHRLRKRFRHLTRAEIDSTVAEPAEVDQELRYLVEALSQAARCD